MFRFSVMALFGTALLFSVSSYINKSAIAQVAEGSLPPGYCSGPTDEIVPCRSIFNDNPSIFNNRNDVNCDALIPYCNPPDIVDPISPQFDDR